MKVGTVATLVAPSAGAVRDGAAGLAVCTFSVKSRVAVTAPATTCIVTVLAPGAEVLLAPSVTWVAPAGGGSDAGLALALTPAGVPGKLIAIVSFRPPTWERFTASGAAFTVVPLWAQTVAEVTGAEITTFGPPQAGWRNATTLLARELLGFSVLLA